MKLKTAKSLGIMKGAFVVTELGFPACVIAHANTATPLVECFGPYHECGSAYAETLRLITWREFVALAATFGHAHLEAISDSEVTRKALKERKE